MADRSKKIEQDATLQGFGARATLPSVEGDGETLSSDRAAPVDDDLVFALGLVGQVLDGKYRLVDLLGQGGMGAVFEAEHVEIGNTVALKVLFPEKRRQRESLARFRREAQAAGTIGHPNIATVFDMGRTEDGISYLVMEFVDGLSLADLVARESSMSSERVIAIGCQVLEALEAAHSRGIVHRDIKPENVMVTVDPEGRDRVRVLDFGISKVRPTGGETHGLTQTGTILGTPMYMAPEQARGEPDMDHRIDLYAVGAMLYVMLTGKNPFQASNYNALLAKILTEEPPPVDSIVDAVDPHLVRVIDKAMARDRDQRFTSAREFIDALCGESVADLRITGETVPSPGARGGSRRVVFWVSLIAVGAVAAVGVGFAAATGAFSQATQSQAALVPAAAGAAEDDGSTAALAPTKTSPAAADGGGRHDGVDEPAAPSHITVQLTTDPPDAEVFISGRQVDNPVDETLLRAERETFIIRIEADGYHDWQATFPRTEDIVRQVELERRVVRQHKTPRTTTKRGNFKVAID